MTSQVYPPERHPSGILWRDLAEFLAQEGCSVNIATGFPNHPEGKIFKGYKRTLSRKEVEGGVTVIRGYHLVSSSRSPVAIGFVMLSQAISYCISAFRINKPEVILCGAPPLVGPLISLMLGRIFRAKVIYVIADIYPDILIDLGLLKNSLSVSLARYLEQFLYQQSDHIVVLSDGFRKIMTEEKKVTPDKISVIPVWLDRQDIVHMDRNNAFRRELNISSDKFVVLYAGGMGWVSGSEVILEAATHLKNHRNIIFLLVSGGKVHDHLEKEARNKGLENLLFAPFQPRTRLSEVQATADVSLVTLASGRGKTSVPSKILGYMAAARPVVAAVDVDCDIANIVRQSGCGLVVPPENGEKLAHAILQYYQNPEKGMIDGQKGRKYFLQQFEKNIVIKKYLDIINKLVL